MSMFFSEILRYMSLSFTARWFWVWLLPIGLLSFFWYRRMQARKQDKALTMSVKRSNSTAIYPSYEGEMSAILFRPAQQDLSQTQRVTRRESSLRVSPLLVCSITRRLPNDPIVVSCGRVFDRRALTAYLHNASNIRSDIGLAYTPGNHPEPCFIQDRGHTRALRSHKVLHKLLTWWGRQSQAVKDLAKSQPEFFFIEIDHKPIIENIALLMPGATCPEGFLDSWYDPEVFFKDPVIDGTGRSIELPQSYQNTIMAYRYNDLGFCTAGPSGPTTVIDRMIWLKPKNDSAVRADVVSSFFDLSKLPTSEQAEHDFVFGYYQDSVVDGLTQLIKPYLANYAAAENLATTRPDVGARP